MLDEALLVVRMKRGELAMRLVGCTSMHPPTILRGSDRNRGCNREPILDRDAAHGGHGARQLRERSRQ